MTWRSLADPTDRFKDPVSVHGQLPRKLLWYNQLSSHHAQARLAKLSVTVRSISVDTQQRNSDLYVKMKIGPVSFQTPRRLLDSQWGDTFDFRINMHAHLFYTLQVDVYEYRMVLASAHLGRAEMRLARLDDMAPQSTRYHHINMGVILNIIVVFIICGIGRTVIFT